MTTKDLFVTCGLFALIAFLLVLSMDLKNSQDYYVPTRPENKPKFEVSDCASYVFEANEFQKERISDIIYKVLKVGKNEYFLLENVNMSIRNQRETVYNIRFFDRDHILVDCVSGKIIKNNK